MKKVEDNKGLGKVPNPNHVEINWDDPKQVNAYAMFSANMLNFMPKLPVGKHLDLYHKLRLQLLLNGNDILLFESDYDLPLQGKEAFLDTINARNGIIATYHFGPFQLINYILIKAEIPYALLVGKETKKAWTRRFPGLMQHLQQAEEKGRFQLLDAADNASLVKMYRLMKDGFHLLIYVDGLEGLDKNTKDPLLNVNFLGQDIFVPKGAPMLSFFSKQPIYPVLLRRGANKIYIEMDRMILPESATDRFSYIQSTSERLFGFLSRFVMHWPEQWTNWTMLHRFLINELPLFDEELIESFEMSERYGLLQFENERYLMEKHSYKLFAVNEVDFNNLKMSWL